LALGSAVAALVVMCSAVRAHPWSMLGILLALPAAVVAGWHVVSRRGVTRVVAGLVVLVAVVAPVLHVLSHRPGALLVTLLLFGFSMASARVALLPAGRRPRPGRRRSGARVARSGRAVLLLNPHSGSGKAAGRGLADLARCSGVQVVAVRPGDDLAALAEAAVAAGAGVLGVAGGDGSMAPVAAVASRHGLPFVCVPAGTRNHFALDLGLDPSDLPHAVTAFQGGVQVRVDLAEVNGRAFVNNVSLGVYAAVVGSRHYRRSKLRALLEQLPDVIGPDSSPLPLRFRAPDGKQHSGAHALLVSNNPYRLGGLGHSAWRPRLDSGSLGVVTVRLEDGRAAARLALLELFGRGHRSSGYSRWRTGTLVVDADEPVTAGLDGEPALLEPRLRFASRPAALVVCLPVAPPRGSLRRVIEESRRLVSAVVGAGPSQVAAPGSGSRAPGLAQRDLFADPQDGPAVDPPARPDQADRRGDQQTHCQEDLPPCGLPEGDPGRHHHR
jgi:diacylglycerol kinase family enzyme